MLRIWKIHGWHERLLRIWGKEGIDMRKASGILADTTELRKMILEHPNYPIAVVVGEEANSGDYSWMCASDITFSTGLILDADQPVNKELIFHDKDDFYEKLEEWLWDKLHEDLPYGVQMDEGEFQKALQAEKDKYEPYWKDCIIIYADN